MSTTAEQYFKKMVEGYRDHQARHQAKVEELAALHQQSDEVEDKIEDLLSRASQLGKEIKAAKENYKVTDFERVQDMEYDRLRMKDELELLKKMSPVVTTAALNAEQLIHTNLPRPPYAAAADMIAERLGPDLYFFLWLWQQGNGRIQLQEGSNRFRHTVLEKAGSFDKNQARFEAMMAEV